MFWLYKNAFFQVDCLLGAALFSLPSYTYQDVGDVLFELMLLDRVSVCHWLEASLKNLPGVEGNIPAAGVTTPTPAVTRKQLVKFHKSATSAEQSKHVSEAIREFSRLWRWNWTRPLFSFLTTTSTVLQPQTGFFIDWHFWNMNFILSLKFRRQGWPCKATFSLFWARKSFLDFQKLKLCTCVYV